MNVLQDGVTCRPEVLEGDLMSSDSSGTFALEISGLTKRYGDFTAVDDLDMVVRKGEFMGLLGPNGAGKSTVLKSISGLLTPTSGTILVNGIDSRDHKEAMSRVGCVIETPMPYPSYTPSEMLTYVGRMCGIPKDEIRVRAKDVLEDLRMWPQRDKKIGGFSKGMIQRISIAAALIHNPDIVLLDEPTSGLDPRGMAEIRQILSELRGRGLTLLISTHMLNEVSELCTSMTLINHGRKIVSGSVGDLVHDLSGRMKGTLLEVRTAKEVPPEFIRELSSLPGVSDAASTGPRSFRVSFAGTDEQRAAIVDLVQSRGLMMLSMDESGEDLESLYMSLTDDGEVSVR